MRRTNRLEASKDCRRVLARHNVDLGRCYYNCSGYEIRLYGRLLKNGGGDFHPTQIENMIQDFKKAVRGISVYGDLDNWSFSSDHVAFLGEKKEHTKADDSIVTFFDEEDYGDEAA
jgi:hypothetical protein